MSKEIKNLFDYMNLDYNASEDEIKSRQKVMIKVLRAKGIKKGKSYTKKIEEINQKTSQILDYIAIYDNSNEKNPHFKITAHELSSMEFVLIIVLIIFLGTFFSLL